jgi:hypothetical protein
MSPVVTAELRRPTTRERAKLYQCNFTTLDRKIPVVKQSCFGIRRTSGSKLRSTSTNQA